MPKNRDRNRNNGEAAGMRDRQSKRSGGWFTDPMTRKEALRQVRTARRLALAPEMQIIKAEQRASKERSKEIKQWFPQYDRAVQEGAQATAGAYSTADQAIAADTTAMADYAEKLRQKLAAEGATDAAARGAAYDTSGSTLNAEAQLARISSANTLGAVISGQGAAQQGYLQDKSRIGKREKIEQLSDEADRRSSLFDERKDLARQGRDIVRDELARLKDSERDYALGLQAAAGESASRRTQKQLARMYGQNTAQEQATSLQNQLTVAERQAQIERQDDRRSQSMIDSNQGSGGGGGNDQSGYSVRQAAAMLRAADKDAFGPSRQAAVDYLINRGVSPQVARKALRRVTPPDADFSQFH